MTFVEMVDRDPETERLQNTRPSDSEDDFLFETIGLIAAVEMMGDRAIIGPVLIEIGIEQQHRDAMPEGQVRRYNHGRIQTSLPSIVTATMASSGFRPVLPPTRRLFHSSARSTETCRNRELECASIRQSFLYS
jgi:hypothetical protein